MFGTDIEINSFSSFYFVIIPCVFYHTNIFFDFPVGTEFLSSVLSIPKLYEY